MRLNRIFRRLGDTVRNLLLQKTDPDQRQKLLGPVSLRTSQIFFDLLPGYPLITQRQKKEIVPFFIIGSGRSGTTLLRSVLMGHPLIHIPPESMGRIPNTVKKFYRYGGLEWRDLVNIILGEFSSFDTFSFWEIDLEPIRKTLYELDASERSLGKILDLIYRTHLSVHKPDAQYWGDKSPFNTLRLKWIDRVFPGAKYINLIRDGRDVVSSYLEAGILSSVEEACRRWNQSVKNADQFRSQGNESRVKTIHYEDLVKNPHDIAYELCVFLEIVFNEQILERRAKVKLGDEQLDHMQNVKNDISQHFVGKWKDNLTETQKREVQKRLSTNLKKHGYPE